jgi:4-amino-4-deoxy-L-arabinose transferase-like glycosyltransferase
MRLLRRGESATATDGVAVPRLRPLLIEFSLLLGLTSVVAFIFARSLRAGAVYDEGVYLASLDALDHGQSLASQVFASQPPGFYILLEAERAIFGGSVVEMRVAMLVLALIGCLSAYYVGRCLAGPRGGLLAMALLATPVQVEDAAVRIRADFPSVALSLVAIALALFAVRRKGTAGLVAATLAGGVLAAAVAVKLLAVTAVVPVLAIMLLHRVGRLALGLGAGAAAVVAALLGVYATVLGPLWDDVVRFHLKAQSAPIHGAPRDLGGNFLKVVGVLTESHRLRSPFLWLVLVGAVGTLLAWRRRQLFDARMLWLWAAATGAFLIWHRPLWAHDVVMLTVSLAVASGVGLADLLVESPLVSRAAAAACVLVMAVTIAHHFQRASSGESAGVAWAAAVLRTHTPQRSEVASDWPIIPFLADRRQPGALVDTSSTRLGSGWLTRAEILRAIDSDRVSAVVVGHYFAADPMLLQALGTRFPVVLRRNGVSLPGERSADIRIYLPR